MYRFEWERNRRMELVFKLFIVNDFFRPCVLFRLQSCSGHRVLYSTYACARGMFALSSSANNHRVSSLLPLSACLISRDITRAHHNHSGNISFAIFVFPFERVTILYHHHHRCRCRRLCICDAYCVLLTFCRALHHIGVGVMCIQTHDTRERRAAYYTSNSLLPKGLIEKNHTRLAGNCTCGKKQQTKTNTRACTF